MPQINVLDKSVYELIAAGEVIERPASIVKELVENSMDAGADQIVIEIKNGGRTYIRVTDNGCGISPEDVPKAFLRHATSKVAEKNDLEKIMTLGFRGEALASVCAVAKVELFTRMPESDLGTHYTISGSGETGCEETGCPKGTTIIVRDLFYNVPARLKFLKKDISEANRIQELITRLAVSRPEVSMKLIRDNKQIFTTAGDGKLYSAVYSVFGRDFANTLLPVRYEREGFAAEGYVSKPIASRPNRKLQVFYVNGRYVRSEVCSQALEEAYRNIMMVGKFPCCVLKLRVMPEITDVNVHPAKTEIRFSDNRYVYDSIYFAVKQALEDKDKPLELHVEKPRLYDSRELYVQPEQKPPEQLGFDVGSEIKAESKKQDSSDLFLQSLERTMEQTEGAEFFAPHRGQLPEPKVPSSRGETQPLPVPPAHDEPSVPQEEKLADEEFVRLCESFEGAGQDGLAPEEQLPAEETPKTQPVPEQAQESEPEPETEQQGEQIPAGFILTNEEGIRRPVKIAPSFAGEETEQTEEPMQVIGELFKTYIVVQRGDSMMLIDKHAAHERHIYESLKFDRRLLSSQTLLEPIMVVLSFDEYDIVSANISKIEHLGFTIEPDVAPTIAIKGLPDIVSTQNPTELMTEMAQKLLHGGSDAAPEFYEYIYKTMACKAAIKAHDDNSLDELRRLAELVFKEDLRYCPHGRPIILKMTEREIEKHFRRIV